jgi:hypothetical protein
VARELTSYSKFSFIFGGGRELPIFDFRESCFDIRLPVVVVVEVGAIVHSRA